jgi:hypothetical protein
MSLHFQFYYLQAIDHQNLLKEVKQFFNNFSPEHIAIGTLDNHTHVYIEVNKQYHIQGKNPLKVKDSTLTLLKS